MRLTTFNIALGCLGTAVSALPEPWWPPHTTCGTATVTETCTETVTETCTESVTITAPNAYPTGGTATTTVVSTSTVSTCPTTTTPIIPIATGACALVNPLCSASGWSLDYYANPFAGFGYPQSGLGPGYYISENLKPLGHSTTQITYFPFTSPDTSLPQVFPGTSYDDGQAPYYVGFSADVSGITIDANNFTLVYTGLYKAPATGNHTFCADADNIIDVFFGAGQGFRCGGSPSADATPSVLGGVATGGNYDDPTTCFDEDLVEGFYYPVRLVLANFQGPFGFGFTIAPPGGSATSDFTGLVYPASCALL